jgi:large subunit ribosomal protein L3
MTMFWEDNGKICPVTVLYFPKNHVAQVKTECNDGYTSVQVSAHAGNGTGINRTAVGHLARWGVKEVKTKLAEFRVSPDALLAPGTELRVQHFVPGQLVDVCGTTIGKGFQGGMKRHGFKGFNATHGVSVTHRALGSTGCRQDPGRVLPGKKMPGHMGSDRVTIQNLWVFYVDPVTATIGVRGAIPGKPGAVVRVTDAIKKPFHWEKKLGIDSPPFPTFTGEDAQEILKAAPSKIRDGI